MLVLCVKSMDKGGYQIQSQATVLDCFYWNFTTKDYFFYKKMWFIGFGFYLKKCLVV